MPICLYTLYAMRSVPLYAMRSVRPCQPANTLYMPRAVSDHAIVPANVSVRSKTPFAMYVIPRSPSRVVIACPFVRGGFPYICRDN